MPTTSSRTELAALDDNNDVIPIDDVSAVVTKKVKVGTILTKVQNGSVFFAADSGSTDAYAITLSPVPASYTTGMVISFTANTANTGAATLNVNSLGAKTIKKNHDADLSTGDIEAGQLVTVGYDGTNFQMQSVSATQGVTANANTEFTGTNTFSGDNTFSGNNTQTGSELFTGNVIAKLNAPEGFLLNGKFTATISGNDLVVALKGYNAEDPSATNPLYINLAGTIRSITTATSITISAGANTMNAGAAEFATKDMDFFTGLLWDSADSLVRLCITRYPGGTKYGDYSSTATNEKHLVLSGGTPASTDPIEIIGRFNATNSGSASYNWSISSALVVNKPIRQTRHLDWVPNGTGYTAGASKYMVENDTCFIVIDSTANITGNISNAPFTAANTVDNQLVTSAGTAVIAKNTKTVTVASNPQNISGFYAI